MFGPPILIDKSVFHALNQQEADCMNRYFHHWPPPILVAEILGDLSKAMKLPRTPEGSVVSLARKIGGSGLPTHTDYRTLLRVSLLGGHVPMEGRPIPAQSRVYLADDGSVTIAIGQTSLNAGILRWRNGHFESSERKFADDWRQQTANPSIAVLQRLLREGHVVIPAIDSAAATMDVVSPLIEAPSLQSLWLTFIVGQAGFSEPERARVLRRWQNSRTQLLRVFAPYAHYCVSAALTVHTVLHNRLVRSDSNDERDLQYLFYLPFYHVFVSDDRLHRAVVPLFLKPYQQFEGLNLKAELQKVVSYLESASPDGTTMGSHGLEPPEGAQSRVNVIWAKWLHGAP
jgi:hypothetical protein